MDSSMYSIQQPSMQLETSYPEIKQLSVNATLQELPLYNFQFEASQPGEEVAQIFQQNPVLPGVILIEQGRFMGILSRRRFLEQMSSPYGLELFLRRPLKSLYRFAQTEVLVLTGDTQIVTAARHCLERPSALLYEPIAVKLTTQTYRLLDAYQLLVAQLYIHELATRLLKQLYQELEVANLQLEELAKSDGLTGVANRRRFDDYLQTCWKQHCVGNSWLSLIMCDVDCFKYYNDTYGHQAGDDCLREVASAIQRQVKRPADLVARYGGEEFVVILPLTPLDGAIQVAQAIAEAVRTLNIPHATSFVSHCVTLSLGVASTIPNPRRSPTTLTAAADAALYQAKSAGRDRVVVHTHWH
ncbi:diguanylate cyclase [Coleofasciculus sp. E1-EBD-02]|uniref:diguanylate cyclase n=1 Tax=Coleofasciculus sp. E1-EBD-02 TaxID=3068481 RepID=UPI0033048ADF